MSAAVGNGVLHNGETGARHKSAAKNVRNFGAGPAKLPDAVMIRAQREFRDYDHAGIGILG